MDGAEVNVVVVVAAAAAAAASGRGDTVDDPARSALTVSFAPSPLRL